MTRDFISIAGVSERDIDLLLLEEFHSSPSFQDWFVAQILGGGADIGEFVFAQRSITQSTGESDLEVAFRRSDGGEVRFLIENKVDAGFQPLQAERYRMRGNNYVARNECAEYHTILVAPQRYFGCEEATKGFDKKLTYEALHQWFLQASELGLRREYKTTLLRSAIEKGTLGYQPIQDAPVTDFWRAYWLLARDYAPELEMKEPSSKPSGSTFIYFAPPSLPNGATVCHKITKGYVDLQLAGMGERLNEVHQTLHPHLRPDMKLTRASQSAAVRMNVPILDPNLSFAEQAPEAKAGLDAARELLAWYLPLAQGTDREA